MGPGAIETSVDDLAAKMQASWEAMVEDKLVKNLKLPSGGNQSRFQEQGVVLAEITSICKSNTGFLREVRNALAEYSQEHRSNPAVVKATESVVESMAEQQAELMETVQKLRDMVEAQTELMQGQREHLNRISPPYRPPPTSSGKGWGNAAPSVPINLDEAIRHPGQPPIYHTANASAPARREDVAMQHMSNLLVQVSEMLHAMRYT